MTLGEFRRSTEHLPDAVPVEVRVEPADPRFPKSGLFVQSDSSETDPRRRYTVVFVGRIAAPYVQPAEEL